LGRPRYDLTIRGSGVVAELSARICESRGLEGERVGGSG